MNTEGDRAVEEQEIATLRQQQVDGILYAAMYHRELRPAGDPARYADRRARRRGRRPGRLLGGAGRGRPAPGTPSASCSTTAPPDRVRHQRGGHSRPPGCGCAATGPRCAAPACRRPRPGGRHATDDRGRLPRPRGRCSAGPTARPRCSASATSWRWAPTRPPRELGLRVPDDLSIVGYDDMRHIADGLYPGPDHRRAAALRDGRVGGAAGCSSRPPRPSSGGSAAGWSGADRSRTAPGG